MGKKALVAGAMLVFALAGCGVQSTEAKKACLADGARTDWVIAISPQATPTDVLAAEELKLHLEEATGAKFAIVSNSTEGVKAIEIGTEKARKLIGEARAAALRPEESVYIQRDGCLAIVGGGKTGNAYGVYSFLERELGCRWFAASGEKLVPKYERLEIPPRDVTERPALKFRKILCTGRAQKTDASDLLFYFRNRINEIDINYENVPREDLKGKIVPRIKDCGPGCHSLFKHIPPEKEFKAHPEWFTLDEKGKRVDDRQLCFSNRQLRDELTKRYLAFVGSFNGGRGSFDLSAMDIDGEFCMCEGCQEMSRKYGSRGGPFFDYLLELSPKLRAAYPEAIVHFLVYRKEQTQRPPKGIERFPDNLVAVFAPIKPPYGGFKRMVNDTKLSVEAGMDGAWYEHDVGTALGHNFGDAMMWMIARCYIEPNRDWRSLRKEYFDFMYAEAADDMARFDDILEVEREKAGWMHWNNCVDGYLSAARIVEFQKLFDGMEAKVGGKAEVVQRLREVRTGLDFNTIRRYSRVRAEIGEAALSVDAVFERLTNTIVRAVARRNDLALPSEVAYREKLLSVIPKIAAELELAKIKVKPLPDELGKLPEARVIQIFPDPQDDNAYARRSHVNLVKDSEAAIGKALFEDMPEAKLPLPYTVGIYDFDAKRPVLETRKIALEEIKAGKFALYKLGRASMPSANCKLWVGSSWRLVKACSIAFVAGERPEYDIYISLKFVGPKFGGAAADKSAVYFDRLVFVRVEGEKPAAKSDRYAYDGTLRDGCWLYGHDPGDHDGLGDSPMNGYNVPLSPAVEIGEVAQMFGLPNVCVCRWGLSDENYRRQFKNVKRLSWVITGSKDERYYKLASHDFNLIGKMPNLMIFDLDDYLRNPERQEDEWIETEKGKVKCAVGALSYDELLRLRKAAKENPIRPIDLQLVLYDHQLREEIRPILEASDIVQYWTWCGKDISEIESRFRRYRELAPKKPTFLGIYMWDYGGHKPLDVAFMKKQLEFGYDLWKRGEVQGFVFHCSNLINKGLPAVQYAREWFALHANERRETAAVHPVPEPVVEKRSTAAIDILNLGITGAEMLARREALDKEGCSNVRLTIGGDEWMPFRGKGVRQILAAADGRIVIVEPSGRVAWQHAVRGKVNAVGALRNWIYYASGGRLLRVKYSLPCDPQAPEEVVCEGTAADGDIVGFDFTLTDLEPNGRIVLGFGKSGEVRVVDPDTHAVKVRFNAGEGIVAVRARARETFSIAHANEVGEYSGAGKPIGDVVRISGAPINDALLLEGGSALVARDEAVEEIGRCGCTLWRFDRKSAPNLAKARFTSVQRIGKHTVIGLSEVGVDPKGIRPTALGVGYDKSVVWSCCSPIDSGMPKVLRLQARRDYD